MRDKNTRQRVIRRLIEKNRVASQEELLELLKEEGLDATQATLSRDLKEMKIVKMHLEGGGYCYSVPPAVVATPLGFNVEHALLAILSVEFSSCLGVVKTRPGFANMIGSVLDLSLGRQVLGTVAGDDTLLVILREGTPANRALAMLEKVIPGISAKWI